LAVDVDILSYVIVGFGCLGILAGIAFLIGTVRFIRSAEPAAATVVEYETRTSRDSEGGTVQLLHPIVEFEDRNGRSQRITMDCGSSGAPPFPTGSLVEGWREVVAPDHAEQAAEPTPTPDRPGD
jgi:hypothetical protein